MALSWINKLYVIWEDHIMNTNVLQFKTDRNRLNQAISLMFEANKKVKDDCPPKEWGIAAKELIRLTRDKGVHIYKDEALMNHLRKLDRSEQISQDLLPAVAEVFARMYMLKKENRLVN